MKINLIILFIFISLANIILSGTDLEQKLSVLKKDEKITLDTNENVVIFDSDSFSEGDKISFKITAAEFDDENIMFEFYDDYDSHVFDMKHDESPERRKDAEDVYDSNDWSGKGTTNFYTIKKDKKYLKTGVKGKYLGIYIDAPGKILVENYKKDESTVIAVIVVVVVVVIIVGIIIYCCIKRKKRLAEMNNGNVYVNNNPNQGNYGQPQNNPNYNMNMNMNKRPQGNNGYNNNNAYNNNGYNNNNAYNNNGYNNNNMGYNNNGPYPNNPQQYSGVPQNSNTMRYG